MDGIVSISQRIAGIQAQLTTLAPPRPAAAGTAAAFEALFTRALSELAPAGVLDPTAPASVPAVLDADGVPADLAVYGNGKVPMSALAPVGDTGHHLWAPAAQKFEDLLAAAAADGVTIGINDSYRTHERQVELAGELGLYPQGGLAAVPGTSRHGWGMAVDLRLNGEALQWMRVNGERFGFVEDTPRETWHWAFYPDRVRP
ncbi:peptidase M15 [Georgenia wutianyii]|uniref:Peptidase M15 n=1 Tax=Georgenia wutianyii TaxID=2585135 RepID=A0ABX5VM96_9MICO|nr:M15 family metallopeptidase [Georgenia wutianyii]QDB79624.1 peptidase M15 [Georgenia wutianyii]